MRSANPTIASQHDFLSTMSSVNLYECLNNYFKPEFISDMKCENCNNIKCEAAANANPKKPKLKGFIKRQAIAKLPETLCIQIQRNSWSDQSGIMIKKTNHVKFPLSIKVDNLTPGVVTSQLNVPSSPMTSSFSLKQVGIGALLGGQQQRNTTPIINKQRAESNAVSGRSPMSTPNMTSPNMAHSYELRSAIVHYGSAHSGHFVAFRKPLNSSLSSNAAASDDWLQISDSDIKRVKQNTLLNSNVYMLFYDKVSHVVLASSEA
jgi:ubiquitin C-terminal hydrolase